MASQIVGPNPNNLSAGAVTTIQVYAASGSYDELLELVTALGMPVQLRALVRALVSHDQTERLLSRRAAAAAVAGGAGVGALRRAVLRDSRSLCCT